MRWKSGLALRSRHGDERIVQRFLFIPRFLKGPEWRWNEWAYIVERVEWDVALVVSTEYYRWKKIRFATEAEVIEYWLQKCVER